MNKNLYLFIVFFSLLLLQVIVFNNILLFGYINPYLYIAFIFIYPFTGNRFLFLTLSFLLGLSVDFFTNSGGANAFATLFIAYLRTYFLRTIFNKSESEDVFFNFKEEPFGRVFNYVAVLTIIHHFILFNLINFSFNNYLNVLINTFLSSVFTLLLYFTGNYIFSNKK
ncbi:MAG: rod shape-determining protein MreD [Tenacibaculum sp.]|nr:rod shape-determining protein MreD [Tenacibaculum sp.]